MTNKKTKKTTTKAVAKKKSGAVAEVAGVSADLVALAQGDLDTNAVDNSDVQVPKVLVMQGQSKHVEAGRLNVGDIGDSVTGELLVKRGEEREVIFFEPFKTWVVFQLVDGKEDFQSIIPYDGQLRQEEELPNGQKLIRYVCMNYHVIFNDDLANDDVKVRVISFRSTSYKMAKVIETERKEWEARNLPLCVKTFKIATTTKENEKGRWFVPDISVARGTAKEEYEGLNPWRQMIKEAMKRGTVKYDDSDLDADKAPEGAIDVQAESSAPINY